MIIAMSRFKVANGMEKAVSDAFLNRPRLVDSARGFLGVETFTDVQDCRVFYLVTRWTDEDAFRRWHSSDDHRASHNGIPKGLKLDAAFTEVTLLDRLDDGPGAIALDELATDRAPLLARFLARSHSTSLVAATCDGVIRTINSALARLLGISSDAALGASIWDFVTSGSRETIEALVRSTDRASHERLLVNLTASTGEISLECEIDAGPDGFVLIGEAPHRAGVRYEEEMAELNNELAVLTRENIRKGRALERALAELKAAQATLVHQEKMASLGQMTAGVAHEINNPISFVLSNTTTLLGDFEGLLGLVNVVGDLLDDIGVECPSACDRIVAKAEEVDIEYLSRAVPRKLLDNVAGLERVGEIVRDLRTFTRLDESSLKPVDVGEGIRAQLRFLSPMLEERGVRIETDFPELLPLTCFPGPLNQAIGNVVTNAVQASREGQTVRISTRSDGDVLRIAVSDDGVGIAPEHLPKIFDAFFTTKPVGEGTGLGLYIARQIVSVHHGDIDVSNGAAGGTVVELRIPCCVGARTNDGEPGESR